MVSETAPSRVDVRRRTTRAQALRRRQRALLALLVLAAAARGGWWAVTADLWHRDEAQHYAYVLSVADGRGVPTIGEDRVDVEVLELAKRSPTNGTSANGLPADVDEPGWDALREQYEGGQGPLYYAALAVVADQLDHLAPEDRVLVLRLVSVALTLVTVPLTAWLARLLFPRSPRAGVLAALTLVAVQGFNTAGATINNDALVVPLATGALVGAAHSWRLGPSSPSTSWTAVCFGAALVTKPTAVVVAPLLLVAVVAIVVRHRPRRSALAAHLAAGSAIAGVIAVPWFVEQAVRYAPEGSVARFNRILDPILGAPRPLEGATVLSYLRDASSGLFELGAYRYPYGSYMLAASAVLGVAAVLGLAVWVVRRHREEVGVALVIVASAPAAFGVLVALTQVALGGVGTIDGRYLHALLPLHAVLVGAAAVSVLRRAAPTAVLGAVALLLWVEIDVDRVYIDRVYLDGLELPGLAPAVDQTFADALAPASGFSVDAGCAVQGIGLTLEGDHPERTTLLASSAPGVPLRSSVVEPVVGRLRRVVFALPPSSATALSVGVQAPPDVRMPVSTDDRSPAVQLADGSGDPVVQLLCAADAPKAERFAQSHGALHPPLTYAAVSAWPLGWAWLATAGSVLAGLRALTGALGGRSEQPGGR